VELDLVADLDVLPLGDDLVGAVDVAADQVLQRVVAVEAAPPLPELGDPGPDVVCRSMKGDGAGCREIAVGDEVVAVQGGVELLVGRPHRSCHRLTTRMQGAATLPMAAAPAAAARRLIRSLARSLIIV
jgi:hypothetical protein